MMKRLSYFSYGVISYAIFFATFLYAIGFVGNIFVPKALDAEPSGSLLLSLLIDLGLLALFAVQHSIMARPWFKRWWTGLIPVVLERSTYVLFSSVALILMYVFWQPLGGVVWAVSDPVGQAVLYGLFAFGWLLVLAATFMINHFDLFGLRQVTLFLTGRDYTPLKFNTPWLYQYVRHPLYVGWFFAFWATPTMTLTHLMFALVTSAYILIAIVFEEKDLSDSLPGYAEYCKQVPKLIPNFSSKQARGGNVSEGSFDHA